jgi:hypothetical protein
MSAGDKLIARLATLIRNPQARPSTRFRAQFLGIGDDLKPFELGVTDLDAMEASAAMREAICMDWPPQAIGVRLVERRLPEVIASTIPEPCAGESPAKAARASTTGEKKTRWHRLAWP